MHGGCASSDDAGDGNAQCRLVANGELAQAPEDERLLDGGENRFDDGRFEQVQLRVITIEI
jgi:hypothetical protein